MRHRLDASLSRCHSQGSVNLTAKKPRQLSRGGPGKNKVVDVTMGGPEVAAQALRRLHAYLTLGLHEFQEMFAFHEIYLAGRGSLSGQLIPHARNHGTHAQGF
jgi:hypothetical protein